MIIYIMNRTVCSACPHLDRVLPLKNGQKQFRNLLVKVFQSYLFFPYTADNLMYFCIEQKLSEGF